MSTTSLRLYHVRSGSSATNSTTVALVAATTKTVLSVLGSANDTIALHRVRVSFNSVTATDAPALVEVGVISALGTVTSFTPAQVSGKAVASSCSAGYNASVEPTFSRIIESTYVPVNNGLFEFWYPLGMEPSAAVSEGFAIRVTAPQAQNCYASLLYSE